MIKPEEQRVAIARACGWTMIEDHSEGLMMPPWTYPVGYPPVNAIVGKKEALPEYDRDLNAMHEAEKVFDNATIDIKSLYWDYLCLCVDMPKDWEDSFLRDYAMIRATAAQRAEAFLRTLNLWKED